MATAPQQHSPPSAAASQAQSQQSSGSQQAPKGGVSQAAALAPVRDVHDRLRRFLNAEGRNLSADTLQAVTSAVDDLAALLPESPHVGPKVGEGPQHPPGSSISGYGDADAEKEAQAHKP